jgi:hypothetical protein
MAQGVIEQSSECYFGGTDQDGVATELGYANNDLFA